MSINKHTKLQMKFHDDGSTGVAFSLAIYVHVYSVSGNSLYPHHTTKVDYYKCAYRIESVVFLLKFFGLILI